MSLPKSTALGGSVVAASAAVGVVLLVLRAGGGSARQGAEPPGYVLPATETHAVDLSLAPAQEPKEIERADASLEVVPAARSEDEDLGEGEEQDFESRMLEKYANLSRGQLLDARLALRSALNDITRGYYEAEFAAGRYETHFLVPDELGRRAIPNVPGELSSLQYKPGGEARLVRLPREGFEHAYSLSEEATWILRRESELERVAKTIRSK